MQPEKQETSVLLTLVAASYIAWLFHSEAVRGFLSNLHRLAGKFIV
jgi:hypothetical protein